MREVGGQMAGLLRGYGRMKEDEREDPRGGVGAVQGPTWR